MSVYSSPHERLTYFLHVILINFSHHSLEASGKPETHTLSPVQFQPNIPIQVNPMQVCEFLSLSPVFPIFSFTFSSVVGGFA